MQAAVARFSTYVFDTGRLFLFFVIGLMVAVFLIVITIGTQGEFLAQPLVYMYALTITVFQFSRLVAAMLYQRSFDAVDSSIQKSSYEPYVSIIIPCKNEEGAIVHTITQCFRVHYPREKLEVIVINDGSTDRTGEILYWLQREQFPHLIIIDWKENKGKRQGMAEGFRRAKGEIVVQIDSDSHMEPTVFRELIQPFRNPTIGSVCAHTDPENADYSWLTKTQAAYYFLAFRILKAAESTFFTVFCCCGCASAYRKNIILPVLDEWLQETFLGLPVTWDDDRALTNYVLRLGYNAIYADKAQAYTIVPDTLRKFFKQQVRWKKGWFTGSLRASTFIWKQRPFVAFTYFFPHMFFTLIAPIALVHLLVIQPIFDDTLPIIYVTSFFVYAAVIVVYYMFLTASHKSSRYWPYIFVWSAINMILLSFVFVYALATIQNRKWGTR